MDTLAIWECRMEERQGENGGPIITGRFPYNSLATRSATGRVRKERFSPGAFDFVLRQEPQREVNFLFGHDLNRPLASRQAGTLDLVDTAEALTFTAHLPPDAEQTTWQRDFLLARRAGLVRGISPQFAVPPASVVPGAETLTPEPGNPGVMIRDIRSAVLFELSAATRPSYPDTSLEERADGLMVPYWQTNPQVLRWL